MAGDWIKIRTDLPTDPDVMKLSDILGTDDPTTVGHLVSFWSWANKQTADGNAIDITQSRLDRLIGRPGFASALRQIGWLDGDDGSLCLPRFTRHNGSSAKARALESEAKRLRRMGQNPSDKLSDKCPTKRAPKVRPEKRREEKILTTILTNGSKSRGTLEEMKSFACELGLPETDGEAMFYKWEGNGWKNGAASVKDWKATLRSWKAAGYLPSQKAPTTAPARRRAHEYPQETLQLPD
jgi:hypothetical protein